MTGALAPGVKEERRMESRLLGKSRPEVRLGPGDSQEFSVVIALVTGLLHLLEALFLVPFESKNDRPRLRKHFGVLYGGCVVERICVHHRDPLDHSQGVAREDTRLVEPGPPIEVGRLDDERIALPTAAG